MKRLSSFYIISSILLAVLVASNLFFGSVSIPPTDVLSSLLGGDVDNDVWKYIVLESRLPQTITAILAGMSLSVCGLMLQTAFHNPLAGPSVFGVSSGAALGVAIVMLLMGGGLGYGSLNTFGLAGIVVAAFLGAMLVTGIVFFFSAHVRSSVILLVIGIMIGYLASSAISLLNYFATEEGVKSYAVWGMGTFSGVSLVNLPIFSVLSVLALLFSSLLVKPLNALLLGDVYAENLGIDTKKVRNMLLLVVGLLTAVTTAFCGPISFIGLSVSHIARIFISTDNHRHLFPSTLIIGAIVALLCNIICFLPPNGTTIPLNAVTPLMGAPVIIYVILSRMRGN